MRRSRRVSVLALSSLAGVTGLMPIPAHATPPGTVGRLYVEDYKLGQSYATLSGSTWTVSKAAPITNLWGFSPDGSRIAWDDNAHAGSLVVSDPDGGNEVPAAWAVPGSAEPAGGYGAAWIDDNRIAFLGTHTVPGTILSTGVVLLSDLARPGASHPAFAHDPSCGDNSLTVSPATGDIAFDCWANGYQIWISHYDKAAGTYADPQLIKTANSIGPDFSPDGSKIAYGDWTTGDVFTMNPDGTNPTQITHRAAKGEYGYTRPVWSPDGKWLATTYGDGNTSVPWTIRIVDLTGNVVSTVGDTDRGASSPVWQPHPWTPPTPPPPAAVPTVHRIGGDDRYDTARKVSQAQWTSGSAGAVVLARGDQAPDALAGVPLAAHVHGPLLLTDSNTLDLRTRDEIGRVLGGPDSKKTVYILGGGAAVSPAIESGLRGAGYTVVRYGGASRFDTALKIAKAFGPTPEVMVATGRNFPDALTAGPLGAILDAPLVLSDDRALDPDTAAFVAAHQVIDEIGDQAVTAVHTLAVADKTLKPLAGDDRFATANAVAAAVVRALGHAPDGAGVANAYAFPDALTGGAFAANAHRPLLLTDPLTATPSMIGTLSDWSAALSVVDVFGGTRAVSQPVVDKIRDGIHGVER